MVLKIRYILLCLNEMCCRSDRSIHLQCLLALAFLCLAFVWVTCLLTRVGYRSLPLPVYGRIYMCDLNCSSVSFVYLGAPIFDAQMLIIAMYSQWIFYFYKYELSLPISFDQFILKSVLSDIKMVHHFACQLHFLEYFVHRC